MEVPVAMMEEGPEGVVIASICNPVIVNSSKGAGPPAE